MSVTCGRRGKKAKNLVWQGLEQRGEIVGSKFDVDTIVVGEDARSQFGLALLQREDFLLDAAADDEFVDEHRLVLTETVSAVGGNKATAATENSLMILFWLMLMKPTVASIRKLILSNRKVVCESSESMSRRIWRASSNNPRHV